MQDIYKSLSTHTCSASAFEIAYRQEKQKLRDLLEANKALAFQLDQERKARNNTYHNITGMSVKPEPKIRESSLGNQDGGSRVPQRDDSENNTKDNQIALKRLAKDVLSGSVRA